MNCKTCGYMLWNLASRTCPECGGAFKPSDFEFAPNAVQFVCPGCEQVYYGTSSTGHLIPDEFDCVRCGRHLLMDEMILRPADWSRADRTGAQINPWTDRARRGRVRAFFATIGWGLGRPGELMRITPPGTPLNDAWWYLIVSFAIYTLAWFLPLAAIMAVTALSGSPGGGLVAFGGAMFGPLATLGVGLLFWVAFVVVWGGLAHLLLIGGKPAGTIRRTYQSLCYTAGPMCFMAVPCIGVYAAPVSLVWWVVSGALAVRESQQVHGGRAVAAVAVWPVLAVAAFVGYIAWFIFSLNATLGVMHMPGGLYTSSLGSAVIASAVTSPTGEGPAHALQLTGGNQWLTTDAFIDQNTATLSMDVPVGPVDLERYENASAAQQQAWMQQAVAAQPADVFAHRFGDYVFTYHGIKLSRNPDPALWTVIYWPDPDANVTPPPPGDLCHVACADGTTRSFPFSRMASELAQQNTLRAANHLPPLPDPATVTHHAPATAP